MINDSPSRGCTLAVFIPTFRRAELLLRCLDSLKYQDTRCAFNIIVADNDAEYGGGEDAAQQWAKSAGFAHRLKTVRVSERGLSHCRNGGLRTAFADPSVQAVAMIDDDTEADPAWISEIEKALSRTNAAIFGGPTIYSFAREVPPWISGADMFQVPYSSFGPVPRLRSSNNCIITRGLYDLLGPNLFDPAFNFTGGEDVYLFSHCQKLGLESVWLPEAKVHEIIPPPRCEEAWVIERHRLSAVNAARIDKMLNGTFTAWVNQLQFAAREILKGLKKSISSEQTIAFTGRLRLVGVAGRINGLLGRLAKHDTAGSH
jgi:glycosyltransferase involved in cell wall biosynthesis